MNFSEKKLRIYGYIIISLFFFIFFMMEMFFTPVKISYLVTKVILVTFPFTLLIWEPTRFIILKIREKYTGINSTWKRLIYILSILIPYGFLIAFVRVFLENHFKIWGYYVAFAWYYTWNIGTVLLFIFVQTAVYESIYFFQQWTKSVAETGELKNLHLKLQFESLKVQIQPHFLFNSLNTLIALIEFNPEKAKKFTTELAQTYRYFLEANDRDLITLKDELDFAMTYFSLLKTRFDEGLYLHVNQHQSLDNFMLPPLSLQILLENAIKHNIISSTDPLNINIDIDIKEKQLKIRNNIQIKRNAISSGHGLKHLQRKFTLMNLPPIIISHNLEKNEFCVTVPFLHVNNEVETDQYMISQS